MITLQRAETSAEVEAIMKNEELFGRVAEDGHCASEYVADMSNCFMLILNNEDVSIKTATNCQPSLDLISS